METASSSIKNWLFSTTLKNSKASLTLAFSSPPPRIKIILFWGRLSLHLKATTCNNYLLFSLHFTLTQQLKLISLNLSKSGTRIGNDLQQKQKCSKSHWISLIVHSQAESTSGINSCFLWKRRLNFSLHDFFPWALPDRNCSLFGKI